jgi:ribosomal protein L12E/L44/L45/RPP1/RPP2
VSFFGSYAVLVECTTKDSFINIEASLNEVLNSIPDVRVDSIRCRMMSIDKKGIDEMEKELKDKFEISEAALLGEDRLKAVLRKQGVDVDE